MSNPDDPDNGPPKQEPAFDPDMDDDLDPDPAEHDHEPDTKYNGEFNCLEIDDQFCTWRVKVCDNGKGVDFFYVPDHCTDIGQFSSRSKMSELHNQIKNSHHGDVVLLDFGQPERSITRGAYIKIYEYAVQETGYVHDSLFEAIDEDVHVLCMYKYMRHRIVQSVIASLMSECETSEEVLEKYSGLDYENRILLVEEAQHANYVAILGVNMETFQDTPGDNHGQTTWRAVDHRWDFLDTAGTKPTHNVDHAGVNIGFCLRCTGPVTPLGHPNDTNVEDRLKVMLCLDCYPAYEEKVAEYKNEDVKEKMRQETKEFMNHMKEIAKDKRSARISNISLSKRSSSNNLADGPPKAASNRERAFDEDRRERAFDEDRREPAFDEDPEEQPLLRSPDGKIFTGHCPFPENSSFEIDSCSISTCDPTIEIATWKKEYILRHPRYVRRFIHLKPSDTCLDGLYHWFKKPDPEKEECLKATILNGPVRFKKPDPEKEECSNATIFDGPVTYDQDQMHDYDDPTIEMNHNRVSGHLHPRGCIQYTHALLKSILRDHGEKKPIPGKEGHYEYTISGEALRMHLPTEAPAIETILPPLADSTRDLDSNYEPWSDDYDSDAAKQHNEEIDEEPMDGVQKLEYLKSKSTKKRKTSSYQKKSH